MGIKTHLLIILFQLKILFMLIKYIGQACFKIISKNLSGEDNHIITEPCSLPGKFKKSLFNSAHIVTSSYNCDQLKELSKLQSKQSDKYPFIIKSPGEYEINNVFVFGLPNWLNNNDKNTQIKQTPGIIYLLRAEGITITHLGNFKQKELTTQQLEYIENTDILFVPLSSDEKNGLTPKNAAAIVSQIEPRIIIPMQYETKDPHSLIQKFTKEMGNSKEELDKLKISKKDLPQEETKLIILKPA